MGKDLNRHFSKNIQITENHMKRCSTSSGVKKMQIKTTVRYHFTPIRMTIIKKRQREEGREEKRGREKKVTSDGEDVEKLEQLFIAGRNLNGNTTVENSMAVSQKNET